MITQNNHSLFSVIYIGALNKDKIDYTKLRQELSKSHIIYILPKDVRKEFEKLYEIHFHNGSDYYNNHKKEIHQCLINIIEQINKHGADIFGK